MRNVKRRSIILLAALIVTGTASINLTNLSQTNFALQTADAGATYDQTLLPKEHAEKIIATLQELYPSAQLPTFVLTEQTPNYVTAATTGSADQDNFNILYYAQDDPIAVDDQVLNELTPIASYQKLTYETEQEAIEAVNQIIDLQGEEVDLGYNLTGYLQGAAGSTYLNWQEGNWSLIVRANNAEEEDPVELGQAVVEYLEKVYLPAPETVGQITLEASSKDDFNANTTIWQEGTVVYRVSHFDAMPVIKMTGSITKPTEQ